ncbi:MAG: nuclear transport factor 2 family protein [Sulfitobacter sp.]|uniref:nuclear transport factor 2 family protein n=1 Tax=Sulfitobacter sp. TaxID=1903071 RepID=UPI0032993EF1
MSPLNSERNSKLLAEILRLEESVWQALVEGDAEADAAALHPDFLGVYPSGFAGRADHAGQLEQGATVESFQITQPRLLELGADHVCLSYLATYRRPSHTEQDRMYVSSIWQRAAGDEGGDQTTGQGWINIFSQDTPTPGSVAV